MCVWVNLDLRALAVNGVGRTVESPATETGRAQSNDERRHIRMRANTMFPDTLSPPEKAWLCEILLNLKTSIKKKKGERKKKHPICLLICPALGFRLGQVEKKIKIKRN